MLEKKITDDLQAALKAGKKTDVSALRMLISSIKNKKIEERSDQLDDEKVMSLVKKMVKQYKDSIEQFTQGGRNDLVEKESRELKVVEKYMPEEMPLDQVRTIVDEVIAETGASSIKDMGQVMKSVLAKTGGQADGKAVSDMVKDVLNN